MTDPDLQIEMSFVKEVGQHPCQGAASEDGNAAPAVEVSLDYNQSRK